MHIQRNKKAFLNYEEASFLSIKEKEIMKKKVVLLGDSIRLIGYGTKLPEIAEDFAEIWQPEDNSRFIQYVLRQIFDCREKISDADIVCFNSGEWDICNVFGDGTFTTPDYYASQLVRIADMLLKKGKKVVFSTTTPVREDNKYNSNDDIRRFNEIALSVLEPMGVVINDLYTVVIADLEANIREDDKIHLSEQGTRLCAEKTAETLRNL